MTYVSETRIGFRTHGICCLRTSLSRITAIVIPFYHVTNMPLILTPRTYEECTGPRQDIGLMYHFVYCTSNYSLIPWSRCSLALGAPSIFSIGMPSAIKPCGLLAISGSAGTSSFRCVVQKSNDSRYYYT